MGYEINFRVTYWVTDINFIVTILVMKYKTSGLLFGLQNKLQGYCDRGESFEVVNNISLLTLDIILRCAFSYDNDCQIKGSVPDPLQRKGIDIDVKKRNRY